MFGAPYWFPDWFNDREAADAKNTEEVTQESITKAQENESMGDVASLQNLKGQPVYILSGLIDKTVDHTYQDSQRDFYEHFEANVLFE